MEQLVWHNEQRLVKDLVPFFKNPRFMTDEQKEHLTKSIIKFNLVEIPAIDIDNVLIAGHQRCSILMMLGRGEELIDVRVPNRKLTEEEFKEYNVRSNANHGSWDLDLLKEFGMENLEDWGLDFDSELKYEKIQNSRSKKDMTEDDDAIEQATQRKPALIKLGDTFSINGHRITCADARDENAIKYLMNGNKAEMVFIDPPYNVKVDSIVNLGKIQHEEFAMASGEMSELEFTAFLNSTFTICKRFSKTSSIHFVCMDWKHIAEVINASKDIYSELKQLCVWVKDNGGMGTFYRSQHELVFVFKNGEGQHINNFELGQMGRYRTNVWQYTGMNSLSNPERADAKLHPTIKPVELVMDAILDCSTTKGIILDLFSGSGTTMISSDKAGRKCYCADLSPIYVETSIRRYINFCKKNEINIEYTHLNGDLLLDQILDNASE